MRHIVRDCRKLPETKKTVLHFHCTCIVKNTWTVFYSHPVVAFSRLKVSMRISVQQGSACIAISRRNAKDALRISLWNTCMMRVTLITDNDVVFWKVCYNSQSQDVLNFHAKIVTSCFSIQNVEWSDALVDTNAGRSWATVTVYSITYKANEWWGGKSIPYNFWCPWFDRHFLQITACLKWTHTPTKRNALNVKTI